MKTMLILLLSLVFISGCQQSDEKFYNFEMATPREVISYEGDLEGFELSSEDCLNELKEEHICDAVSMFDPTKSSGQGCQSNIDEWNCMFSSIDVSLWDDMVGLNEGDSAWKKYQYRLTCSCWMI